MLKINWLKTLIINSRMNARLWACACTWSCTCACTYACACDCGVTQTFIVQAKIQNRP